MEVHEDQVHEDEEDELVYYKSDDEDEGLVSDFDWGESDIDNDISEKEIDANLLSWAWDV